MKTGYFANTKRFTKVHIVTSGKPLCGVRIGTDKQFQFCANGVYRRYVECARCRRKIETPHPHT